jgi:hypothetical protein
LPGVQRSYSGQNGLALKGDAINGCSISQSGAPRAPDAGDCDRPFELRRDHSAFLEAMRSGILASIASKDAGISEPGLLSEKS